MASIDTNGGSSGKRNKLQKKVLRVDFTPMVDMNMLLITFFMFCTTLSIPQAMDIALPANTNEKDPIPGSKSVTVILGENDKIYYYAGLPDYDDYTSLQEFNHSQLRKTLLERNTSNIGRIQELKRHKFKKEISEAEFKKQIDEVKKSKDGLMVLIKPTKESNYENLVDVLDEMQICGVGKYSIVDIEECDSFLLENLKSKGQLTAMANVRSQAQ